MIKHHAKPYLLLTVFIGILIFSFTFQRNRQPLHAGPYKKQWAQVDSLEKEGLTRSALEIVEKIYSQAGKDELPDELVKTILYKIKYKQEIEEDALVNSLKYLEEEIGPAEFPEKQILHSLTATMYQTYYEQNRWKILDRTQTVGFDPSDIATWDANKFVRTVVSHFHASLENPKQLQELPVDSIDAILIEKESGRRYRPTLYDLLAHRAIDYFTGEEPSITQPAFAFEIDDPKFYAPYAEFTEFKLSAKDSLSYKFYGLKLLQDLLSVRTGENNPGALILADLKRLQFVHGNATLQEKDSLYESSLLKLLQQFPNDSAIADVGFELASLYYDQGNTFNPGENEKHRWKLKEAIETCSMIAEKFPESTGGKNCAILMSQIEQPELGINMEKVNLPGRPLRALINYKNLDTTYLRMVKIDYWDYIKYRGNDRNDLFRKLLDKEPVNEWRQFLVNNNDYQEHSVEIKIPGVSNGFYILLVFPGPYYKAEIEDDRSTIAHIPFWTSDLSLVLRGMGNAPGSEGYVFHRNSGRPLEDVEVQLWHHSYSYSSKRYDYKKGQKLTTDKNGRFETKPAKNDERSFFLELKTKDDHLFIDNGFYQNTTERINNVPYQRTHFFLDRKIYRPGQIIYFKGIVLSTGLMNTAKEGENTRIVPNHTTTIELLDANYQKVSELKVTTNEFGTFHGSFTAPVGVVGGQMQIKDDNGSEFFSVEEYKRPKFEVTFEPVEGSYKLNDSVKVDGLANAFAGYPIDNGTVKFRVTRTASFPYWWYYYNPGRYSQETQITSGTVTTGEDGKFSITFLAQPDPSVPEKDQPVFRYQVEADVTDITGETRSTTTSIQIGYTALKLAVNVPEMMNKENTLEFPVTATNLSNEPVDTKINVRIHKLQEPDKVYRTRLWQQPDVHVMDEREFKDLFPYDIYKDELNKRTWKKEKEVLKTDITTKDNGKIDLKKAETWQAGVYVLEATATDKYGTVVKDIRYFTLFSPESKKIPGKQAEWFTALKDNGEPGEKAQFLIGSSWEDVQVLYEVEHNGQIVSKDWIKLDEEQKLIEIPIEEKHRGGFGIHFTYIKHNRVYANSHLIHVPRTDKKLNIEFITFRDKLLPGQEEEWKLKISGAQGDQVMAELVAGMYDASLDEFRSNSWDLNLYRSYHIQLGFSRLENFGVQSASAGRRYWRGRYVNRSFDQLNWFGADWSYGWRFKMAGITGGVPAEYSNRMDNVMIVDDLVEAEDADGMAESKMEMVAEPKNKSIEMSSRKVEGPEQEKQDQEIQPRKNFNETAFFYPDLETNENGEVIINFTIPEALTRWKMLGLAHTKDLKIGTITEEVITQKDLMVIPNAPRFFREGDEIEFTAKVTNLSDQELQGSARLQLFDALSMKPVDDRFDNTDNKRSFTSKKGKSSVVVWKIRVPEGLGTVTYRVTGSTATHTDGEEKAIPILTNRMLVTEAMPIPVRGEETKTFQFEKLVNSSPEKGGSKTLKHHKLTLEFTPNPVWYAIQALPYMMEYPYECSEQIFSRYYANSIASYVANSKPAIKRVFEQWKSKDTDAFLSNLEKNQELKSLLLEETPWVLNARDESERKKRIALLFDMNKMAREKYSAMTKLRDKQLPNGAWPWFDGGYGDPYITRHIIAGLGHVENLGVADFEKDSEEREIRFMIVKALEYLDHEIKDQYNRLIENEIDLDKNHLSYSVIHYLYTRSFFKDDHIEKASEKAVEYYTGQAKKYWLSQSRYMQGMIALTLHRDGDKDIPAKIIRSLKENAIYSDELGMYWKENTGGYFWYQAPIESQALLMEAFDEIANDEKSVEEMKIWLLKNKQVNDWKTTKATAEACYALLLRGMDALDQGQVEIKLGSEMINSATVQDAEAGTGYFKRSWTKQEITPDMGKIEVTKTDKGIAWGAVYWQYFEQLDKITPHKTPLQLNKKLFVERNSDAGPVLKPLSSEDLAPGDRIIVRIELRVDRDMEYIHMKDMRASGLEPENVLSKYKYQGGLGYYESTKDASTNFFFSGLPRGTYVFEYPLRVTHKGDFSNGITSIQSMYAPEFGSHSEGVRVVVE